MKHLIDIESMYTAEGTYVRSNLVKLKLFLMVENNDGRTRVDTALLESFVADLSFVNVFSLEYNLDSIRQFQRIFEDGDALFLQFIDRPGAIYLDCLDGFLLNRFGSENVDIVFFVVLVHIFLIGEIKL